MKNNSRFVILLVDDQPQVREMLSEALERIGIESEIDIRIPTERARPFGCELPAGDELERYDVAVIDLELFTKFGSPLSYSPEDLRGGSEVLPYLRREAPWLPVVALSSHFTSEVHDFLVVAGGFGFDGVLPKILLSVSQRDSATLKRVTWDNMLIAARRLRNIAAVGEGAYDWRSDRASNLQLEIPVPARVALSETFDSWEEVMRDLLFFAEKVTFIPMGGGYSGAQVFRAYVQLGSEGGRFEGEWLVKVGKPRKLHLEAQAHLHMARSGVDFARVVPLLWRSVITHGSTAALAYQFARGTIEAGEYLRTNGLEEFSSKLVPILYDFYGDRISHRSILGNIVDEWIGSDNLFEALGGVEVTALLNESVKIKQCLIHGDLHLGNIMIGDRNVLIDFAHSRVGPIAFDAAKLFSDILLKAGDVRSQGFPFWFSLGERIHSQASRLQEIFRLDEDDVRLFNVFIVGLLIKSTGYKDTSSEARAWIKKVLKNLSVESLWKTTY